VNRSSLATFGKNHGAVAALARWWHSLSLSRQFLILSSILLLISFAVLGFWVANKIEASVKIDIGLRAALYMENSLSPHLQELEVAPDLSPQSREIIESILQRDVQRLDVLETRIWNLHGMVLFATIPALVGKSYTITEDIEMAMAGEVAIDFDQNQHEGEATEVYSVTRFEIYVPIRSETTGNVIAVAEFYQNGEAVIAAIAAARKETWVVTSLVCLHLMAGLYIVVDQGSRLIAQQRAALDQRVAELTALLGQNEDLRHKVDEATQRSTEDYEARLRRIGSDLHDGIGQLLTIVLLRLEKLFPGKTDQTPDYRTIKAMLDDSMTEIRHMSAGLALPEIKEMSLAEAVKSVVARHEYQTATKVNLTMTSVPIEPSHPVRLGICRMIQEGLNNAFKHADGLGQTVTLDCSDSRISVEVSDRGKGIVPTRGTVKREALGLIGLRNRLESMGGVLSIKSDPAKGTVLHVVFAVPTEGSRIE
jgi:signal transduction histidine kinase